MLPNLRQWGPPLVALVLAVLVIDQNLHPDENDDVDTQALAVPVRHARDEAPVNEAPADDAGRATALQNPLVRTDRLQARQGVRAEPIGDLFASKSWQPPPPKPLPPPLPPPPRAPPFPYTYLGGMSDEGKLTAYFGAGERVIVARAGDVINGAYRVDSLAAGQMQLTYLPLNQQLVIPIGALR
jgi:hypothetical protein